MITIINGFVFFPHRANWTVQPMHRRLWQTEMAEVLPGAETRQALRAVPRRELSFMLLSRTLAESSRLEARIDAALKSGQACAPLHGRAATLNAIAHAGDTTLTLAAGGGWNWQAGDYAAAVSDDLTFDVQPVTAVAGNVLTLNAALTHDWAPGSLIWPVLFGRFKTDKQGILTGHHATVKITLQELTSSRSAQIGVTPAVPIGVGQQVVGTSNTVG